MKFLILQLLITDKKGEVYNSLVSTFGILHIEYFYYNFIKSFPHLDLTWLEQIYNEDKENVLGMTKDIYMMILGDFINYEDYLRHN